MIENMIFNEVALLTRCYTQHALRSYMDSKINHIRHFIKILFVNIDIEFINSPSIFRCNNVVSSIPSYVENTESPTICYKYNKHVRNTIRNFNKTVSNLDLDLDDPRILELVKILNFVINQRFILSQVI